MTTWDVTANGGQGGEVPSGSRPTLLLSAHRDSESRRSADDIIHGIALDAGCRRWDQHPGVRQWRQDRYKAAVAAGLDTQDAISQTIPVVLSGFFDDSTDSTCDLVFAFLFPR